MIIELLRKNDGHLRQNGRRSRWWIGKYPSWKGTCYKTQQVFFKDGVHLIGMVITWKCFQGIYCTVEFFWITIKTQTRKRETLIPIFAFLEPKSTDSTAKRENEEILFNYMYNICEKSAGKWSNSVSPPFAHQFSKSRKKHRTINFFRCTDI